MEGANIVIDNGSSTTRAGFSGEQTPRATFPTVIGKPKHQGIIVGMGIMPNYIGQQAISRSGMLNINQSVITYQISDWQDMTAIWKYCFQNQLQVQSSQHNCLLTQPFKTTHHSKEKITQIMFQTFEVPAFYLATQQYLALHLSGKSTGIVIDAGNYTISCVPFFQGKIIQEAVKTITLGGRDLTNYMLKLLLERGYHLSSKLQRKIIKDAKENLGHIAVDYESQMKNIESGKYAGKKLELPDGQPIYLDKELFTGPQLMFNPKLIGMQQEGLSESIHQSIEKCDAAIRKDLYSNIILSGGSTMFPGFAQRIKKDITALAPQGTVVNVIAPQNRIYSTWMGGSKMASSEDFKQKWITRDQYQQNGPAIVFKKCE